MKKFLVVVVAVVILTSSITIGFSLSITPDELSTYFYFINLGNGNYSLPVDFSVVPSSISGDFGNLNSWEEFIRRSSSNDYSFFCFGLGPNSKFMYISYLDTSKFSIYLYRKSHTNSNGSSHYDKEYYLRSSDPFPFVRLQFDEEKNTYIPISSAAYIPKSSSYSLKLAYVYDSTCDAYKNGFTGTRWSHSFVYPSFTPTYSSYIKFLDVNSLVLLDSISMSHTLTVNYLYANEQPAAESVTQTIAAGAEYSIQSPEITGYTPSIQVVSGTMPEEDLTVNVYYAKTFYDLTVKYQHQDGTEAAPEVAYQYPAGFVYDIPSPTVSGYQPDKPSVYGEMPGEAVTETVTYSPIPYPLYPDGELPLCGRHGGGGKSSAAALQG